MSQRPRNTVGGGTGGIAQLGFSNTNPNLSEFIDNGAPGFPNDSFITVENRLSQPINVAPSLFGASADYSSYFTVPPLTRSTIPIDPERGVLLSVDNTTQIFARDASALQLLTYEKRTVPYRLHSNGAAPSEPLYPLHRCLFASNDLIINPAGLNFQFVGGAWPGIANQQMAVGPDGICIVAVTLEVYNNSMNAGSIIDMGYYLDPTNSSQFTALNLAPSGIPVGTRITLALPGAVAIAFSSPGGGPYSITCGYWIGIPGS